MSKDLVLQTDFGLADGAVSTMHGVAKTVDSELAVSDLTHEIPPYDIWTASYRLYQTVKYWPQGTTFVSVVDPGVGSDRKSIGVLTNTGHYIITPDNGSITHIARYFGIQAVRIIDENTNRLPHSQESHTFHGRDVYVYNGARLAAQQSDFESLGQELPVDEITTLSLIEPINQDGVLTGIVDILDIRFGSLWTNIPFEFLKQAGIEREDTIEVTIFHEDIQVYQNLMPFVRSFADVSVGMPLVYVNSLVNVGIAVNQNSFSSQYDIGIGNNWKVQLRKVK